MPLPSDFQRLIAPCPVAADGPAYIRALHGQAAYQRRFYVHGLDAAAQRFGLRSSRALWTYLEETCPQAIAGGMDAERHDNPAVQAILDAVPAQWIIDLPDINDRGDALAHTTYWREFSRDQLSKAWDCKAQTLPKALLALAALHVAVTAKGIDWQANEGAAPVSIKPSLFWLVDYTEEVHDRCIAASVAMAREAYQACGLEFDVGPNRRNDALKNAAMGQATLTFDTAKCLERWVNQMHRFECGPIRVAWEAHRLGVADEIIL